MKLKNILLAIFLFVFTGIGSFFAKGDKMPKYVATPSAYSISNENISVNIDSQGMIHSFTTKKYKNAYHKTDEVIMPLQINDPFAKEGKNYINPGYAGEGFIGHNKWELVLSSKDSILLRSKGEKHTILRRIELTQDSVIIKDKLENYNGFAKYNVLIEGSHDSKGKFFIIQSKGKQLKDIDNSFTKPIYLLFSKSPNITTVEKRTDQDFFGYITPNNFLVVIKNRQKEGNFTKYSDPNRNYAALSSLVEKESFTEIYVLPNSYSILSKYGFQDAIYYGWIDFLGKSLVISLDFFLTKSPTFLSFCAFFVLVLLVIGLLLFWMEKRKRDSQGLEMMLLSQGLSPQEIIVKKFKFMIVAFILNIFIQIIGLYFLLNITMKNTFLLKNVSFLWIKDLSQGDVGSIFNLYGLIDLELKSLFNINFNYFGVFSVLLCFGTYIFYEIDTKMQNELTGNTQENSKVFAYFFVFVFVGLCQSIAQIFCCLFFYCGKTLILKIIQHILKKRNSINYQQYR